MTSTVASERWAQVVGQDRAVAQLQRAAERPVHAYLLVGPRGSGIEEAARCFAAAVVAPDGNDRSWDLVLRGVHPDVVEVDPPATQIRVEDAQLIVDEASRSPIEGERKVILLFDAERLRLNEAAANKLLKTLEEPPPRAMIVLVTSGADQLLPTIRSRCQRVDFAFLGADVGGGRAPGRRRRRPSGPSSWRASPADGSTGRARSTAASGRCARRSSTAAGAVDGSGGAVAVQAALVQDALQGAVTELEAAQAAEAEQLAEQLEAAGYPERTQRGAVATTRGAAQARAPAGRAPTRCSRASPRWRRCTATPWPVPVPSRSTSTATVLALSPAGAAAALDACREARQAIAEFNPNETLLLERLLLHLPAAGDGPMSVTGPAPRPVHSPPRRSSSDGRAAHS